MHLPRPLSRALARAASRPLSRAASRPLSRAVPAAASVAAATAALALGAALSAPVALAQELPGGADTTNADALNSSDLLWANPLARSADPDNGVRALVLAQSTARAHSGDLLRLTVRLSNSSDSPLSGLELRAQRADAVPTPDGVSTSLLANQGEYPWIGDFVALGDSTIAPGQSRDIEITVPVGDGPVGDGSTGADDSGAVTLPGLGITDPGVQPLLFNFNGMLGDTDTSFLAAARTTLTVTADSTADDPENTENTGDTTPGLTLLWPLSTGSLPVAGQVGSAPDPAELYLADETLAGELAEGGRLRGLLDTYRDALAGPQGDALRTASCLAVDPDLLETVDRMTDGYRVGSSVPSPVQEPTRLRDSWGHRDRDDDVKGTGTEAASTWLEELRDLAAGSCVVPLPFANADLNAVASGRDPGLAETLLTRGTHAVEEILGVTPVPGVQIPASGYVNPGALTALRTDPGEPVTAVVADSTVTVEYPADGADGTEDIEDAEHAEDARDTGTTRSAVAAVTADNPAGADGAPVRTLSFPADLGAALAATGSHPETAAYTPPHTRRDFRTDGAASRMAAAVGVLDLELDAARAGTGQVLAVPPAAWSVDHDDAAAFLTAVTGHLSDGSADPVSLTAALAAPAAEGTLIPDQSENDPAPVNDGEARNVAQIAGHLRGLTNIMEDSPNIALTRDVFTRPMFDDLLRSISDTGRREQASSQETRRLGAARTGQVTGLAYSLRNSVSLLPPGNVFTRTSDSSPLIIVARNGLPLPVTVRVNYTAANGVTLNTPGVKQLPAKGSVTLQMTSSMPTDSPPSDLTLYLSTPDDLRISEDVTIRVTSVPGLDWRALASVAVGLAVVFLTGRTLWKRRRTDNGSPSGHSVQEDGARD